MLVGPGAPVPSGGPRARGSWDFVWSACSGLSILTRGAGGLVCCCCGGPCHATAAWFSHCFLCCERSPLGTELQCRAFPRRPSVQPPVFGPQHYLHFTEHNSPQDLCVSQGTLGASDRNKTKLANPKVDLIGSCNGKDWR